MQGRATKSLRTAWCVLGARAAEGSQRAVSVPCGTPRGHGALGVGDSGPGVVTCYVLAGADSRGDGDSRALCALAGQSTSRATGGTMALRIKDKYIVYPFLAKTVSTYVEVQTRMRKSLEGCTLKC